MCKIFHFYNGTTFKLKLLRFCSPLFTWTASKASLPSATELPSDLCFSSANCKESTPRSRKMGSMLARNCWRGYKRWLTLHYITLQNVLSHSPLEKLTTGWNVCIWTSLVLPQHQHSSAQFEQVHLNKERHQTVYFFKLFNSKNEIHILYRLITKTLETHGIIF